LFRKIVAALDLEYAIFKKQHRQFLTQITARSYERNLFRKKLAVRRNGHRTRKPSAPVEHLLDSIVSLIVLALPVLNVGLSTAQDEKEWTAS